MIRLFAVESPLQALCAVEVALGQPYDKKHIIVRLSSQPADFKSNNQILKIIKLYNWDDIVIHQIKHHKNFIFRHYETINFLRNIEKKYKCRVKTLYIGDFMYQFMHLVRCAVHSPETILLDDGVGTISAINKYIKHGLYYPKDRLKGSKNPFKSYISRIIYKRYTKESLLNKKIKVLTAFHRTDSNHGVEKLEFKNIHSLKTRKSINHDTTVYYFGSAYSESKIISLEYELEFLNKIYSYYLSKGLQLIYFPHRKDSEEKLNYISTNLGIEIRRIDDIAEYYLLTSNNLPTEVSGSITSTLNNVKALLPNLQLRSFLLDKKEINPERYQVVFDVYEHYRALGIEVKALK